MGEQPKTRAVSLLIFAIWFILALLASSAWSQETVYRAISSTPSAEARIRLYQEISAEVDALERQGNLLKKVVKLVRPTVVHIEAKGEEEQGTGVYRRPPLEEAGSGVIVRIKERYFVLTNRHVITHAPEANISINLADGRRLQPKNKWEDPATDVAVMEIAATGLIEARLGNSKKVEIGDFVLAVGSPFGLSHSVTYGIISAKGRRDLKLGAAGLRFQDFMQTDAAINPGNSGGPLLNLRGEVIGINTAIASASGGNEGIGFTIPINMFMSVANQLIEKGYVQRAFLGVHLNARFSPRQALALGLPRRMGAHVTAITPGSPAELAKLQPDDVILEFDGVAIEDDSHLVNIVSLTPLDKHVNLVIFRSGKPLAMKVGVGDRAKFHPDP